MGLEKRIILTGYVDEPTLACLYSGASAFVYPSLYEGFGLPVLEAMACGCPVVCSNRASLPEVAGDAAIQIDPHDPEALAHSLEKVLHDSDLRNRLITAGLQRARLFSWKKTASETLDIFKRAAGKTGG
jgi:alpha-1,3-rhamnosyl/mannosyltransferase